MLLNGGIYDNRRIVSRATVERFTRRAGVPWLDACPGVGHRGGRDGDAELDPRPPGYSSAGSRLSPRSFGPTGFTGTSLWIDPEHRFFLILLTNRVHPTRENNAIRQVRASLADAVAGALAP